MNRRKFIKFAAASGAAMVLPVSALRIPGTTQVVKITGYVWSYEYLIRPPRILISLMVGVPEAGISLSAGIYCDSLEDLFSNYWEMDRMESAVLEAMNLRFASRGWRPEFAPDGRGFRKLALDWNKKRSSE